MKNTEIEYKQSLTLNEYRILKTYFIGVGSKEYKQENYYFETDDLKLKDSKQALRIRVKGNSYEICLKTQKDKVIIEDNIDISKEEFINILKDNSLIKKYVDVDLDVKLKGSLITNRIDYIIDSGTFSLDRSTYNNKEDYEIEFEANELDSESILIEFLKSFEIEFKENKISKVQRFMESLK